MGLIIQKALVWIDNQTVTFYHDVFLKVIVPLILLIWWIPEMMKNKQNNEWGQGKPWFFFWAN